MISGKKNAFELLKLRAHLIASFNGPLPSSCLLPDRYEFDVFSSRDVCEDCLTELRNYRTVTQKPVGIMVGKPTIRHHLKQCSACGRIYRFEALAKLKPRYGQYSFDLIVERGKTRFLHNKQAQEIAADLAERFSLRIPHTTINALSGTFLDYTAEIHGTHGSTIRHHLAAQGGLVLYLDGTCEAGTDTLFVAFDGTTSWVLDSCKMHSENISDIARFLTRIITAYGHPMAIVSDMSSHIAEAIKKVVPQIPHFICHYHFLINVGKQLLASHHGDLTKHFRRLKIQSSLKSLRNDLLRYARNGPAIKPSEVQCFLEDPQDIRTLHPVQAQRYLASLMLHWLKDYKSDLRGEYFPFDLPALALYHRGVKLATIIDSLLSVNDSLPHQWQPLITIMKHLAPVLTDQALLKSAARLMKAEKLFVKLREVLRLAGTKNRPVLRQNGRGQGAEPRTMEKQMSVLAKMLKETMQTDPDEDKKEDARIVMTYLEKYWNNLFGQMNIVGSDGKPLPINRTNNIAEQFFAVKKRGIRRKVGNKKLAKNIQAMRPEEFLAANLRNAQYVDVIFGGMRNIPAVFAQFQGEVASRRREKKAQEIDRIFPLTKTILRKGDLLNNISRCAIELLATTHD